MEVPMESTRRWDEGPDASFAEKLLGHDDEAFSRGLLRISTGTALAYAFGLAVSVADPAPVRMLEALAIAAVPLAFALFYAPSLWVLLTLFDHSVEPATVARAAVRSVGVTGLVLGGLAPAVVFFELTAGSVDASYFAAMLELLALTCASVLGLRSFVRDLISALPTAERSYTAMGIILAVAMLGAVLAMRFHPDTIDQLHGGYDHDRCEHASY
jgi:hypothetical protein